MIGNDPSKIYGMLTSNGRLVLLNPSGIWFGPNARVNTQSLVAAAGTLTPAQMQQFKQTGQLNISLKSLIRNEGRIEVPDRGTVVLLGAQVENIGQIHARQGQVQLATGPQATLDFSGDGMLNLAVIDSSQPGQVDDPNLTGGVKQAGLIDVGSGIVSMTAARAAQHLDSVISVGGTVVADSVSTQGGRILLGSADRIDVGGALSASGTTGGTITMRGGAIHVADSASVKAAGTQSGGAWLIDSDKVDITGPGASSGISGAVIGRSLATNNVVVSARDRINVDAPVAATGVGRVLDASGKPGAATLALIASGNPGQVSTYEGTDKRNESGSVHISAPILLQDGNLFIAATGDVRLVDNARSGETGDAAWNKRAIVSLGNGIAWLKTSNTASVIQDPNTALMAGQVAVQGASVQLASPLNYAGTLAGKASNGVFVFNQTNASGSTNVGPIVAPFSGQVMNDVKAEQIVQLGSTEVVADWNATDPGNPYKTVNLACPTGSRSTTWCSKPPATWTGTAIP